MERSSLAVILAAGDSTRMKSSKSKVLHPVAGRPMIGHVVEAVAGAGVGAVALVVGRDADNVAAAASLKGLQVEAFLQKERKGTGHAVLAAREAIERGFDDVIVAYGDVPLITSATLDRAREAIADGADVAVIGFHTDRPRVTGGFWSRMASWSRSARKRTPPTRSARSPVQQRIDGNQRPQCAGSAG